MREKLKVINFHVRLSPVDKEKLNQLSAQTGKQASEIIRELIHREADKQPAKMAA